MDFELPLNPVAVCSSLEVILKSAKNHLNELKTVKIISTTHQAVSVSNFLKKLRKYSPKSTRNLKINREEKPVLEE